MRRHYFASCRRRLIATPLRCRHIDTSYARHAAAYDAAAATLDVAATIFDDADAFAATMFATYAIQIFFSSMPSP